MTGAAQPYKQGKGGETMNKVLLGGVAAAALALAAGAAQAADKFTVQLKWVTQAQFAGYYVAKDKGFYKEVDLDVTVKPGGPDIAPPQVMAGGGADVIVDWMPSALASREKGVPRVNVSQTFQSSGMMLTCAKATGVKSPADFPGRTLGVWFFGNEYPFLAWMAKLNIPTDGSAKGVKVLKQGFNVDPLIQKQADCISTMTYNEYWQVIDAGFKPDDLIVFKYSEQGVGLLEDGLYANGDKLKDAAYKDKVARFVAASNKGWDWAAKNPDAAAMIVLENDTTGAQTEKHQKRMMGEVAKLVAGSKNGTGYLDPAQADQTVAILLSAQSTPVITKKPEGAWTNEVFELSKKYAK
jgi:NitT/TauT family transport system substrate-binding protein